MWLQGAGGAARAGSKAVGGAGEKGEAETCVQGAFNMMQRSIMHAKHIA